MRAVQSTSLRSSIARLLVLVLRRIFVGLHLYLSSGGGVLYLELDLDDPGSIVV